MIILWKARLMPGRVFPVQWSSEELYTKDRFCYDKENRQLQTEMLTEYPGRQWIKTRQNVEKQQDI